MSTQMPSAPDAAPDAKTPLGSLLRHGGWWALLVIVAVTVHAWWLVLDLPLTGEDYRILSRIDQVGDGFISIFRPIADAWLRMLNGLADGWSLPYHVASVALHAVNASLLFVLATRLLGSRPAGFVVAILFAINAANTDAVAWLAAVNRPLATFGALLTLLAMLRIPVTTRSACYLMLVGFLIQLGSNAEAYGTSVLVIPWLAVTGGLASGRLRRSAFSMAGIFGALLIVHFVFLLKVPGGASGGLVQGVSAAWDATVRRLEAVGDGLGLGLPALLGSSAIGMLALVRAGRATSAIFCALYLGASFLPFVFAGSPAYRNYPTTAPIALLIGAAAFVWATAPGRWIRLQWVVATVIVTLGLIGSRMPREELLERWAEAGTELAAAEEAVHALNASGQGIPWVSLNLDVTTTQLFAYHLREPFSTIMDIVAFLDTPTGYVAPTKRLPGPWFGRRWDGSFGIVDPDVYFEGRVAVPGVMLSRHVTRAHSLDEALDLLWSGQIDVTREVVLETVDRDDWPDALDKLSEHPALDPERSHAELLADPVLDIVENRVQMMVRVVTRHPVLLCVQEEWLHHASTRLSPDAALVLRTGDPRLAQLAARIEEGGRVLRTFFANAYGFAVLVPPGTHDIVLEFSNDSRRPFRERDLARLEAQR